VAGAVVLDITREQQQSGGVRRKIRVGWKRERVAKIGFSAARIWVAMDKAEHVAS
jgi:hypothetical protein